MDAQAAVAGIRARWRAATSAFNQTCSIADEVRGPDETRAHLAARRERRHSRGSASLGTSAGSDPSFSCETIAGRRSTSRLRKLMDYLLTPGVVSAGMIANELAVTPRGAQSLVGELALRESQRKCATPGVRNNVSDPKRTARPEMKREKTRLPDTKRDRKANVADAASPAIRRG
jgi:hypothetical protein